MQMGRYYKHRLTFHVENYLQQKEQVPEIVNHKVVEYTTLKLKWPEIKNVEQIDEAKLLFRLANT